MPIRWRFNVYLAVGSTGACTLAESLGLWRFGSGIVNLRASAGTSTREKKVPKCPWASHHQPATTHHGSCHNPGTRMRLLLVALQRKVLIPRLGDPLLPQLSTPSLHQLRGSADPANTLALAGFPVARPSRRAAVFPSLHCFDYYWQMSMSFNESILHSHCDLFQVA